MCAPDQENLVFFYEASDRAALDAYVSSGALEVGTGDALFRDGSVLMLVTDAATSMAFGDQFEQVSH